MAISALGDQPLSAAARWVSSPDQRGTFNVLSDCILTLVLCVWTAMHLNIPKARDGRNEGRESESFSFPWKKVKYVVLGLIMPEVVAAVAFNQWLEQRSLLKYINEETKLGAQDRISKDSASRRASDEEMAHAVSSSIDNAEATNLEKRAAEGGSGIQASSTIKPVQEESPSTGSASHRTTSPWTSLHCWYALMGGFTIENTPGSYPFPFPNAHTRLTLTSDAIKKLAKHHPDIFPYIQASEIADKSKSSELAKFIVCAQISWFIINTIGRVGQGLPLTVLELNTAAHCICTFVTYAFWWHKPLDIVQPSAVTLTEEAAKLVAHMCIRSDQVSWLLREPDSYARESRWRRFKGYWGNEVGEEQDLDEGAILVISPPDITAFKLCVVAEETDRASRWLKIHLKTDEELTPSELERTSYDGSNSRARIHEFPTILHLLDLANTHHLDSASSPDSWDHSPFSSSWLTLANPNHPFATLKLIATGSSGYSFLAACTLYALVHGFAWNGPFRSKVELYLWRMGVLAFVPLILLTPIIFVAVWRRSDAYAAVDQWLRTPLRRAIRARQVALEKAKTLPGCWLVQVCYAFLLAAACFLDIPRLFFRILVSRPTVFFYACFTTLGFLTGRAFLVIEAFLALPYAPDGVFVQTQWLAYLPHFG